MSLFLDLITPKFFLPLVAPFIVVSLAIPASATDQLTGKLVITGSSTIAPVISEIGKRFESLHPGVRIDVQTGGSSRGIADVREGLADIGMSSRALKDQEKNGLTSSLLARDGVCFLVHKNNPIKELSDQQIRDIFTGKLTHWNQAGGLHAPITVINRADGRSELELFSHHFQIKPMDIKAHLIAGDNEQGIKTLAGNPNAIIYMSVGTSEYDAAQGVPLKLLPLNGIAATTENIRTGSFPFARPLLLVTKPDAKPPTKEFVEFALSSKVHDVIKELSFVPIQ
ncbi:MAG: phosphate ABC transporter substrate-binding protein [Nitrospira sp.]|nr:phosphate ABC transporter substrate-binding protein [Nitrospira sp.]